MATMEEIRNGSGTAEVQKNGENEVQSTVWFDCFELYGRKQEQKRSTVLFNCVSRGTPRLIVNG